MADQNELYELQQRIARLPVGDQLLVVEVILAGIRNSRFTDHEEIKQEIAATEAWYAKQQRATGLAEEAKREAG